MSRKKVEFRHRNSVFEGAYRAWTHLGGLNDEELQKKSVQELVPVNIRISNNIKGSTTSTDTHEYKYKPLPRSGLKHPFVIAVLYEWLGVNADNDVVKKEGLETLRTWWQHRKQNGGNKTFREILLKEEKIQEVVNIYTSSFFHLAHILIVRDSNAQPPQSLYYMKMMVSDNNKKRKCSQIIEGNDLSDKNSLRLQNLLTEKNPSPLTPLERIHAAQKQHFGDTASFRNAPDANECGKCLSGKINHPTPTAQHGFSQKTDWLENNDQQSCSDNRASFDQLLHRAPVESETSVRANQHYNTYHGVASQGMEKLEMDGRSSSLAVTFTERPFDLEEDNIGLNSQTEQQRDLSSLQDFDYWARNWEIVRDRLHDDEDKTLL